MGLTRMVGVTSPLYQQPGRWRKPLRKISERHAPVSHPSGEGRTSLHCVDRVELLSQWPAHGTDEAGFVIEHCQAEFLAAGRNVHVDRYHHAVIYDLLIGCSVEG